MSPPGAFALRFNVSFELATRKVYPPSPLDSKQSQQLRTAASRVSLAALHSWLRGRHPSRHAHCVEPEMRCWRPGPNQALKQIAAEPPETLGYWLEMLEGE